MRQVRDSSGMLSQPEMKFIQDRLHWLFCRMVHDANNLRCGTDGLKVRVHQARCALMTSKMTVFSCSALRPQEGVAVKPHAGPSIHAPQFLASNQTLEKIRNFRGYAGVQSYPGRTKESANVDFSTGLVGLGVAITAFASLVQDNVRVRGRNTKPECRMIAPSELSSVHRRRVADPYRHFGIDRNSILRVIESLSSGRPLQAVGGMG